MNCAQQDCSRFQINGVPTLRLFYGGNDGQGINMNPDTEQAKLKAGLLQQLEIAQSYGFLKSENFPNFLPIS